MTDRPVPPQVMLQLNLDAIRNVAVEAARAAADVVGIAMQLIDSAGPEATPKHQGGFAHYDFGTTGTAEERFAARRRWLLVRGFQDITVAVRRAFEDADMLLAVAQENGPQRQTTSVELTTMLARLRRAANRANLPDLLKRIEGRLGEPLAYSDEILSLNRVRNCLEHRRGLVGPDDLDSGKDQLSLQFPRLRVFYIHRGQEVELAIGQQLPDDPDDGVGFPIMMQRETSRVAFKVGEIIDLTAEHFAELTFAVWFFVEDLRKKVRDCPIVQALPKTGAARDSA